MGSLKSSASDIQMSLIDDLNKLIKQLDNKIIGRTFYLKELEKLKNEPS